MKKEELAQAIDEVREAWEAALAELGAAGLERPGVDDGRPVREQLAIFNGWDRWNLVQLRCAFSGEIPTNDELTGGIPYPPRDTFSIDAMNAMFVAGTRAMPAAEIVRDWRRVSDLRAAWVSAASQTMLEAVIGADWSGQSPRIWRLVSEVPSASDPLPVWKLILDQLEMQQHHLQAVRDWLLTARRSPPAAG